MTHCCWRWLLLLLLLLLLTGATPTADYRYVWFYSVTYCRWYLGLVSSESAVMHLALVTGKEVSGVCGIGNRQGGWVQWCAIWHMSPRTEWSSSAVFMRTCNHVSHIHNRFLGKQTTVSWPWLSNFARPVYILHVINISSGFLKCDRLGSFV